MMHDMGIINIEVYKNREGRFVARVTLTDPTWDWKPYVLPPQLVGTTEPGRARLSEMLVDAQELAFQLGMRAITKAMEPIENV